MAKSKSAPSEGVTDTAREVDVAIVGGGVSGLYSAWRLLTGSGAAKPSVQIFECSDRIGGKLETIFMPGMPHVRVYVPNRAPGAISFPAATT